MESENLVPNPSFEEYSKTPIGWYYRGSHFTSVMRYWSSATAASPDAFSPKVRVPEHWADKGFGEQKVRTGASMVGITVYGCEEGNLTVESIFKCNYWNRLCLLKPTTLNFG
ncbi:MAG: hypothetical protein HC912_02945 [Saprospiraceae bacterium]|nr:hypothetical protein [Saprospiraceae bacterium]